MNLIMTAVFQAQAIVTAHPYVDNLKTQGFLLVAAGLGATFAILYRISRQVARATIDEGQNFQVIVSLALGLVSGTILAQLLPIGQVGALGTLTKPTLALLGGFSSSLVFRILTRISETVESLFAADSEQAADASQALADARHTKERSELASELTRVKGAVAPTAGPELDALIGRLLSSGPISD